MGLFESMLGWALLVTGIIGVNVCCGLFTNHYRQLKTLRWRVAYLERTLDQLVAHHRAERRRYPSLDAERLAAGAYRPAVNDGVHTRN